MIAINQTGTGVARIDRSRSARGEERESARGNSLGLRRTSRRPVARRWRSPCRPVSHDQANGEATTCARDPVRRDDLKTLAGCPSRLDYA